MSLSKQLHQLENLFTYQMIDSCAGDGLCEISCPVDIDTGQLVRLLKTKNHSTFQNRLSIFLANNLSLTEKTLRSVLWGVDRVQYVFGDQTLQNISSKLHDLTGGKIPKWHPSFPTLRRRRPRPLPITDRSTESIVYFPSCLCRTMGPPTSSNTSQSHIEATLSVLKKAHYNVIMPSKTEGLCCGLPFSNKGFIDASSIATQKILHELDNISEKGKHLILCDTSPCSAHLLEHLPPHLKVLDPISFSEKHLLSRLQLQPLHGKAVIHPPCSAQKLGLEQNMKRVAEQCISEVNFLSNSSTCCAFAGDKGFTHPELCASSLSTCRTDVEKDGYSTSRTCEIGLSQHTGASFSSLFHLIDKASL